MEAHIASFRGSVKRRSTNQMILVVDGITSKEKANALVGKTAVWTAP